jgi:hypothetical protein
VANKAILLHATDDVATALTDLRAGEEVPVALDERSVRVVLRDDIAFGHKYALHDIPQGETILKYGLPIGRALTDIRAGEWVHVHNCRSERFGSRRREAGWDRA